MLWAGVAAGTPIGWAMGIAEHPASPAGSAGPSGPVYLEAAAHDGGDGLQVVWVRADHKVVAADGALHHACVDDVGGGGAGRYRSDGAGLPVVEGLHVASG